MRVDIAVVGAGAAGLATAIFAARRNPAARIALLDGAAVIGAKILVSGGGRCNVTNAQVTERDFQGGSPAVVRRILRAFPSEAARAFFTELGVALHEEEGGKLFPDSQKARTVLTALMGEAARRAVFVVPKRRVLQVTPSEEGFRLETKGEAVFASRVCLATGGLSLPKTGSDGLGLAIARSLGHALVPTTPALVPLVLEGATHASLRGVSQRAALAVRRKDCGKAVVLEGSLLWTHFGVSGPVALDASRHFLRGRVEGEEPRMTLNLLPGETFESLEGWLLSLARNRPRASVKAALASRLPAAVAEEALRAGSVDPQISLSQLPRQARRKLVESVVCLVLDVRDSRGYDFAEVTAGGVPLSEVDPATLQSRKCPGLHFAGEILDVDGRLGGFNFQWAWSSAFVAAWGLVSGGSTLTRLQNARA